jgi:hypothetical protein
MLVQVEGKSVKVISNIRSWSIICNHPGFLHQALVLQLSFHMMGVGGIFGGALLSAIHGANSIVPSIKLAFIL